MAKKRPKLIRAGLKVYITGLRNQRFDAVVWAEASPDGGVHIRVKANNHSLDEIINMKVAGGLALHTALGRDPQTMNDVFSLCPHVA